MPVEEKIIKSNANQTKEAPLASGIEDLFTDAWKTATPVGHTPPKDSKDDILNLFNKVCLTMLEVRAQEILYHKFYTILHAAWYMQSGMVSPFSMHQQQLAALAQQQALLMDAAAPKLAQQPRGSSVNGLPNQNWGASPGVHRPWQVCL